MNVTLVPNGATTSFQGRFCRDGASVIISRERLVEWATHTHIEQTSCHASQISDELVPEGRGIGWTKLKSDLWPPLNLSVGENKRRAPPYEGSSEQDKTGAICSHLRRCPRRNSFPCHFLEKKKKGGERNLFKLGHGTGKKIEIHF